MKKTILGLSLLAALASTQVMAQEGNRYFSGQVGRSEYKGDTGDLPSGVSIDKKDTSYGFAFGQRFSNMVALEVGYVDFGKAKVGGSYLGVPFSGDARARGPQVSLIFSAPVADTFSIYGRVGVARTDRKVTACAAGVVCASDSETKTEALYGVGMGYAFARNLTGTLEYQKLNDTDVSAVNVGVRIGF